METTEIKKLRHAVVGVGAGVFSMHAAPLQLPNVELVGACDIDPDRGQARAAALGVPFYVDYRQMLADLHPEVLVCTTPHHCHAEIAIAAMRAGAHVLVEKPMALSVREADEMVQTARETGRLLAVNFQQRHRPEVRAARRLICEGRLGAVQRITMFMPWPRSSYYYQRGTWRATWWGEGGGVLMNQAPHDLDMICHLLGEPARVFAWTRTNVHTIPVEDTASALLEWHDGAVGFLYVSTGEAAPKQDVEIVGTRGILRLGSGTLGFQEFESEVAEFLTTVQSSFPHLPLKDVPVALDEGQGDHTAVYRDFHQAILTGGKPLADGVEGRMSLQLANAIIYSSHTRAPVDLPLDGEKYESLLDDLKRSG